MCDLWRFIVPRPGERCSSVLGRLKVGTESSPTRDTFSGSMSGWHSRPSARSMRSQRRSASAWARSSRRPARGRPRRSSGSGSRTGIRTRASTTCLDNSAARARAAAGRRPAREHHRPKARRGPGSRPGSVRRRRSPCTGTSRRRWSARGTARGSRRPRARDPGVPARTRAHRRCRRARRR